ncbi:MAG: LLM class flavin-dependent oxidoreductase [Acidimicrobiia bacterium]|nr:LLM class flavin-dependent oxidoreductase [Acidimicrobiia bacterium]
MVTPPSTEYAWFGALCDDDYEYLGVPDPTLRSSWGHCLDIVRTAEHAGFDNVLLPSGYALGIDTTAFAAGIAPLLEHMRMLVAVRCGELWPPQLARQLATLDQMSGGRLTINIISSDRPGETLESEPRYRRTLEVMQILRSLLDGESIEYHGEFYDLTIDPPLARTVAGTCPPFYFGGLSDPAREVAAEAADVYLMWPDTLGEVASTIADLQGRARVHGRTLRFGYRVHVIVRETEAEAHAAAERLVSRLDVPAGDAIRSQSLDAQSVGVRRQAELRAQSVADDGYIEESLWTGIGRARSGCGAAIVGDPDQVRAKLAAYRALGIDTFILSGYPHREEAERFGALVLGHPSGEGAGR